MIRASYGLAGIVYEVTFTIKPLEIIRFDYRRARCRRDHADSRSRTSSRRTTPSCAGRCATRSSSRRATGPASSGTPSSPTRGASRWSFLAAFVARGLREHSISTGLTNVLEDLGAEHRGRRSTELLGATDGFTLYDPDKMIDYTNTPPSAQYAFTFWAFPRNDWVRNLNDYVAFADHHFAQLRIPLQHAARVVFHQAGHELDALVHV